MLRLHFRLFAILAAGVLLAQPVLCLAQGVTWKQVLEAPEPPAMISAKDLPESFRAVQVAVSAENGLSYLTRTMLIGMRGGQAQGLMPYLGAIFTDGTTVEVEGARYLVGYRLMDPMITPEGQATVSHQMLRTLVRAASVDVMQVQPQLTKANLLAVLGPEPQTMVDTPFSSAREASLRTQSLSNLKQLALGVIIYMSDSDDVFPAAQSTTAVQYVTQPYLKNIDLWKNPNPAGGRYLFNTRLAGLSQTQLDAPAETVMMFEDRPWSDGMRGVAYADGNARRIREAEFQRQLQATFKLPRAKRLLPPDYGVKEWAELLRTRGDRG